MARVTISPGRALRGECDVPSDKSIAHRALLLGAVAAGLTRIRNIHIGADNQATLDLIASLGVLARTAHDEVRIVGAGWTGLRAPAGPIDCANSGTTMRLGAGLLAGCPFEARLTGDASLLRRPMGRVIAPLRSMGARIESAAGDYPPLVVHGGPLQAISYRLPVASAQVKSAVLLAGLQAAGETTVIEPEPTRDHTERLLSQFGVAVRITPAAETSATGTAAREIAVSGGARPTGTTIDLPGDFSSAAFLLVAGLLVPGSDLTVRNVGLNPTRTGLLDVLQAMGGAVEVLPGDTPENHEPMGAVRVRASGLHGTTVDPRLVPRLIDEIPLLCIAAACGAGATRITGASELRVKESDRISAMACELGGLGVRVEELSDGLVIEGNGPVDDAHGLPLRGGTCNSHGDHRIAMALAVAGLVAKDGVSVDGAEVAGVSFPGFYEQLQGLANA